MFISNYWQKMATLDVCKMEFMMGLFFAAAAGIFIFFLY